MKSTASAKGAVPAKSARPASRRAPAGPPARVAVGRMAAVGVSRIRSALGGLDPQLSVVEGEAVQPRQPWRDLGPIVAVVALALVVLGGLAVLPARTWLAQRNNLNQARTELAQDQADVASLQQDLAVLQTDAEVERLARKDFDLVFPGEESYRIVPPSQATPSGSG